MALTYTTVDRVHNMVPMIGSISTLTSAQTVELLEYAEAQLNTRLAKMYSIPVAGTVPMLQSLATDIGVYEVLAKRIFTNERLKDSVWPDRFKEALETADKIAEGEITLVDSAGNIIGADTTIAELKTTTDGYHPTFADGISFKDMRHDTDKVDAQMDERGIGLIRRIT
jgi:phage gp36-like protein